MARMDRREAVAAVAAAVALGSAGAAAAQEADRGEVWTDVWGLALGGYDAVSYFGADGPRRGSRAFELHWRGGAWLFADMDKMEAFARAPTSFAPAFGGYCAQTLAAAQRLVGCDPNVFVIHSGRLVLMSDADMRAAWLNDAEAHFAASDSAYRAHFGYSDD